MVPARRRRTQAAPSRQAAAEEWGMSRLNRRKALPAAVLAALLASTALTAARAQTAAPAVQIGATDIGGVVTGPNGPEAGVWVIAETTDLPTKYAKIVVTDDQGRYVIPDLPQ